MFIQKLSSSISIVLAMLFLVTVPGVIISTLPSQTPNGAIDINPLFPVPVGRTTKASSFGLVLKWEKIFKYASICGFLSFLFHSI
jgi:hypothetical protein